MSPIHVVGAAIVEHGRCLVARRGPGRSFAGKWEFPGGKVEPGEAPEVALAREIHEELGLTIEVQGLIARGEASVSSRPLVLDVYAARIRAGELCLHEHAEACWVSEPSLFGYDWADADIPIVAPVAAFLRELSANARLPR